MLTVSAVSDNSWFVNLKAAPPAADRVTEALVSRKSLLTFCCRPAELMRADLMTGA